MTTRPLLMVDVDHLPRERWPLDGSVAIVLRGRMFTIEPVGCVLCVELEGNDHVTLCHVDAHGAEYFLCLTHGELSPVEYVLEKTYLVRISSITRTGEQTVDDTMLFPVEMKLAERNALIERLLDEAAAAEDEVGAAPSD